MKASVNGWTIGNTCKSSTWGFIVKMTYRSISYAPQGFVWADTKQEAAGLAVEMASTGRAPKGRWYPMQEGAYRLESA